MGLEEGARQIIVGCLNVQPDEQVVVVADTTRDEVGVALFEEASNVGADAVLALISPRNREHEEPPANLAQMMTESDVVILATSASMTHARARRAANRAGARVISLPGVTEEMLTDGALTADHLQLQQVMRRLRGRVRGGRRLRVTTGAGTDLEMEIRGREWIAEDTGLCRRPRDTATLPAGEIFIAPVEPRSQGRIVVDVAFEEPLGTSASIAIEEGIAGRIVGAQRAVREMNRGGKEGRTLGKFGVGLNPKARLAGGHFESLKALGAASFTFGDNRAFGGRVDCGVRVDAVVREVTVEVDGKLVIERGKVNI